MRQPDRARPRRDAGAPSRGATYLIGAVDFLPRIGGVSTYTHHVAASLVARGHRCIVLAPGSEGADPCRASYEVVRDSHAAPRGNGHVARVIDRYRVRQLVQDIVRAEGIDMMLATHAHYFGSALFDVARGRRIPFGLVFHGFELRQLVLRPRVMLQSRLPRHLQPGPARVVAMARAADVVFANSTYTAKLVARTGGHAIVTGCGVDLGEFVGPAGQLPPYDAASKRDMRRQLELPTGPLLGFVGRLVPSKNARALIRALPALDDWHLVIVGDGPERATLVREAERLQVRERIRWCGATNDVEKRAFLRAMDVCCLPSVEQPNGAVEGFGIVLLEALASGTPVVVNRSGGMSDVVTHGVTGLTCDAEDPLALAHAVRSLGANQTLAAQCVERGQTLITTRFHWDAVAQVIDDAMHRAR